MQRRTFLRHGLAACPVLVLAALWGAIPSRAENQYPPFCQKRLLQRRAGLDPLLQYQVREKAAYCDGTTERRDSSPKRVVGIVHRCPDDARVESLANKKRIVLTWAKPELSGAARIAVTSSIEHIPYRLDAEVPAAAGTFDWDARIVGALGHPGRRLSREDLPPLVLIDVRGTSFDWKGSTPELRRQVHLPVRWGATRECVGKEVYFLTLTGPAGRISDALVRLRRVWPSETPTTARPGACDTGSGDVSPLRFRKLFGETFTTIQIGSESFRTPGIYQIDICVLPDDAPAESKAYLPLFVAHGPLRATP